MLLRILKTLREPSTWAGVGVAIGSFGLFGLSPDAWDSVLTAIMAAAGAAAVVLTEKLDDR